jgi:C4-dicarboxylate transporter DctQ subunit
MQAILQGIRAVERRTIAFCMIVMSGLYFVNVVVRNAVPSLSAQVVWIEEAALFILGWMVFVGLGLTLERGRQIAMVAVLDAVRPSLRKLLLRLINLCGLIFSLYIAFIGVELTLFVLRSGQVSPTLDISVAFLYGSIPVGFALLAFRYFLELVGITDRTSVVAEVSSH